MNSYYTVLFDNEINRDDFDRYVKDEEWYGTLQIKRYRNKYYTIWYGDDKGYNINSSHPLFVNVLSYWPNDFRKTIKIDKSIALLHVRDECSLVRFICREVLVYDNIAWIEKVEE
jgi:hypothetical protein